MIFGVNLTPTSPYTNESFEVVASVDDSSEIVLVLFEYWDGSVWRNLSMQADAVVTNQYSVTVPPIGTVGTMDARVYALDAKGNWGVSSLIEIEVRQVPPSTTTQTGPTMTDTLILGLASAGGAGILIGALIGAFGGRRLRKG